MKAVHVSRIYGNNLQGSTHLLTTLITYPIGQVRHTAHCRGDTISYRYNMFTLDILGDNGDTKTLFQ
jgi:hypothetical protein